MSKELMQQNIDKAQREIDAKKEQVKQGKMRQYYHFMPQTGWLNDPNGLIYYKGKYHFFYQYNPYEGFWSRMHWGHAVSEDMLHWEYLPLALAPSESYDDHHQGGCFSGSAIEHDGKLFLMYTGTTNNGRGFEQSQCIAYSEDGIHFEKYAGNPVLTAPEGIPGDFFRDPKLWKHEDTYYVICGANKDGMAQALLYRSDDMLHWEFVNILAESRGEWGYMWECPDFYPIGDKYVLMFSPMGAKERTSVYLVGDFDYQTGKFYYTVTGEIDWGFDYYAPQSFLAPDGRRIIVGWANAWDWMPFWKDWGPTYREGWCGFFNLPREVVLCEDSTLKFVPIRELEQLRRDVQSEETCIVEDKNSFSLKDGAVYELKLKINLKETTAKVIRMDLRCSGERKTVIKFDLNKGEISFDRNQSDGWSKGIAKSPINLMRKDILDIHIFSDQSSIELFSNDYKNNISCDVFTDDEEQKNSILAEGGRIYFEELKFWELERACE